MKKKTITIILIITSILLVTIYTIASTYSVIINVIEKDGKNEIINEITIKDILTNDNGNYNNIYYDVLYELNITSEEADILIESPSLNNSLQIVLNSIVDYNLNKQNKMTDNDLYNLIVTSVNEDNNINEELKNKVITKSQTYIKDISDYLYNIEVSLLGDI